jgi:hypothetical protein
VKKRVLSQGKKGWLCKKSVYFFQVSAESIKVLLKNVFNRAETCNFANANANANYLSIFIIQFIKQIWMEFLVYYLKNVLRIRN